MILDSVRAARTSASICFLDADDRLWGTQVDGAQVLGGDELLEGARALSASHFIVGTGSIGDSSLRERLYDAAIAGGLEPFTVIHPSASCAPAAAVRGGSFVGPGAVINTGTTIGVNVIVNSGAIVEHDCRVNDHVHIASGAVLGGGVVVEAGAHLGSGAILRQRVNIGARAIVGSGAVVIRDVAAAATVVGVPAEELRT